MVAVYKRLEPTRVQAAMAKWLRKERERRKLTQRAWGRRFGWSRSFVALIETGNVALGLRTIVRIAKKEKMKVSKMLAKAGV